MSSMMKLTSWSWSRYADYQQCPAKAKYKHILKMKEPGSAAMNRGAMVHDVLADFISSRIKDIPKILQYEFGGKIFEEDFPDLKFIMPELKKYRTARKKKNHGMTVEDSWAFKRDWSDTQWDDWTGCWVRIKLDLAHLENRRTELIVTDWKTGKARPEEIEAYKEQLKLYALGGMLKYPRAKAIYPRLVFIDAGVIYPGKEDDVIVWGGDEVEDLKTEWSANVSKMFRDRSFVPRPNAKCKWCHYRKQNNGPCEY